MPCSIIAAPRRAHTRSGTGILRSERRPITPPRSAPGASHSCRSGTFHNLSPRPLRGQCGRRHQRGWLGQDCPSRPTTSRAFRVRASAGGALWSRPSHLGSARWYSAIRTARIGRIRRMRHRTGADESAPDGLLGRSSLRCQGEGREFESRRPLNAKPQPRWGFVASGRQTTRWGRVWDNPAERAHRIVVPPPELHPPTPAELQHLLGHIETHDARFHALVLLAATTGARRAQLLRLTWEQVHHDHQRVAFTRGWVQGTTGSMVAPTKTKRRHSVEVSTLTYDTLIALRKDDSSGFVISDDGG